MKERQYKIKGQNDNIAILILRLIFDVCSINIAFNTKHGDVVSTYVCWEILLFVGSKLPWIWWPNQPTNKYQTALSVWFRLTETTQNNEHSFYIFCSIILIWVSEWVSEWVIECNAKLAVVQLAIFITRTSLQKHMYVKRLHCDWPVRGTFRITQGKGEKFIRDQCFCIVCLFYDTIEI